MPFDPVLMLETAALLLVAFLIGATVGSLFRMAVLRARAAPASAAVVAATTDGQGTSTLVAAPVIAPLAVPREPVIPKEIPVPDFVAAPTAPPPSELAPARTPGAATSGRDVGRYDRALRSLASEAVPASAISPITPEADPAVPHVDEAPAVHATPVPDPVGPVEGNPTTDALAAGAASAADAPAAPPALDVTSELLALVPASELAPVKAAAVDRGQSAADAEAAAMRAIEGNWTPGRRPQSVEPVAAPTVEQASPAAERPADPSVLTASEPNAVERVLEVASATDELVVVVEDDAADAIPADANRSNVVPDVLPQHESDRIVPAEVSEEPEPAADERMEPTLAPAAYAATPVAQDQPPGLGAPRHGMRDDLTQIVGVLPVVETTLNRLGVYHFDQVADWSDAHASWVEAHLGIAGRIEREHWREQARELAAIASGKHPGRKRRPS